MDKLSFWSKFQFHHDYFGAGTLPEFSGRGGGALWKLLIMIVEESVLGITAH